jgi:hypothetical protein
LIEPQNTVSKQSVSRNKYSSLSKLSKYDNKQKIAGQQKGEKFISKQSDAPVSLEVYESSGNIRSEQPILLGKEIDIII